MRKEFEIYIKDSFGEADQEVLTDALRLFEQFSLPNYQERYISLIMDYSMSDPQQLSDAFKFSMFQDLTMLVNYHGIHVNDHAESADLVALLDGLQVLENYDDAAAIVQYLDQDGSNEDVFADLLTLTTAKHDTYFLNFIASVKPALLKRLKEMYQAGANRSKTDSDDPEVEANVVRLKKLYEYDYFKGCIGYELIQMNVPLGLEFVAYAQFLRPRIEEAEDEQAAKEIVVVLAMSRDGLLLPQQTYQKYSDTFWDDIARISKVDLAITRVLGLIEKAAIEETNEANFSEQV